MSLTLLKTLIAISEQGSFSAAASFVGVSQAAVGQQMKRLEESLQVSLFDRASSPPKLNQLGHALVPKARDIIDAYDRLLDDLPGTENWSGELTLGAVPSTIRGLVPLSVKALMETAPGLRIRVVPGLSYDLIEQVERDALDAAILTEPSRISRSLSWQPFVEEPMVLLTSAEVEETDPHKLLENMPFIRHTRRATVGELADEWLSSNKITVNTSMEMESLESVASMVSYGLGVSIVPDICVPDPIFDGLQKIPLKPTARPRVLGMVTRHDCSKARLVERLLAEVKTTIGI